MLIFERVEENIGIVLEFDPYIPLTVLVDSEKRLDLSYWRGGNGGNSLVEIGLDKKTGMLSSVTLTMIERTRVRHTRAQLSRGAIHESGLPVFNTEAWQQARPNVYSDIFCDDFNQQFNVDIGTTYICVSFEKIERPQMILECGRFRVGISRDKLLSSLTVDALTEEEIRTFVSAL